MCRSLWLPGSGLDGLQDTTTQIAEAYRRWGVSSATKDLIVVKVLFPSVSSTFLAKSPHGVSTHLQTHVKGRRVPFTDEEIASSTDWTKLKKYYKLNGAAKLESIKDEKNKQTEAEALILGAMALRGV
jgi:EKC/KEOPS complex subunit CGI121/TPRKB